MSLRENEQWNWEVGCPCGFCLLGVEPPLSNTGLNVDLPVYSLHELPVVTSKQQIWSSDTVSANHVSDMRKRGFSATNVGVSGHELR